MSTKRTALRRTAAGAGALALAMAGAMVMGTAASAAPGPDQVDPDTTGSLTIHKYQGATGQDVEDLDPADLLDGVTFTATRVGTGTAEACVAIDLREIDDWSGIEALFEQPNTDPVTLPTGYCLLTGAANVLTSTTGAGANPSGQAIFPNLPLGVFLVQETAPGDNPIVSAVPDFFVAIPTSNGADEDGWNYDVIAYPKNQLMEGPTKTIDELPDGMVVGAEVTWNMTVPVPTLNNNETFHTAIITDTLDSRLTYVANSTVMSIGGTDLSEGTHYSVSGNAVWTLNGTGREILDANMGEDLLISFDTVVNSVGNGAIPNDDYESNFNGTTVPGDPDPYTYWGQLSILKTDDSTPVLNLAGAEFQVFDTDEAGTCAATAPSDGAIATGTSNASGVVQWVGVTPANPLGLWIANVDNGPADPTPTKDYCVYETVIPAGHTATPIDNPITISAGSITQPNLTVVNPKTEGPDLPLTGAQGTLAMTIGGLLLVGVGTGAIVVSRRRRNLA